MLIEQTAPNPEPSPERNLNQIKASFRSHEMEEKMLGPDVGQSVIIRVAPS